ncbi:CDP-diacylglycerol--serine O-phosphatidyltransferase [Desulfobotulus alkaliphilus]|uniref:CDP-diacylglycerol--serine O-phosphatidyltransferase n=1 Tax=Desulfobotulus alkaliphilus TaxID=622671 RepID=A0A562S751_9BACT|nr:CDP-diacylglycerol--serine O-phosphatidyltransferase [Desulfobotulus alkaliphilus]TWI77239.1 CDP-diacylglycerol--serine O-phosphatidyltransferase [Desulfobotulus alkaliphilus]
MKKAKGMSRPRRGVYVLPNLLTSMNLFCGFYAIISAINAQFETAAISIFVAIVFDVLDGKVARATNTTSRFGVEYDSLADLISFGLAPGLLIYMWALQPMGRLGWLAAFLFTVCGALRLARFNAAADSAPGSDFTGLPIPGAAAMAATTLLLCERTMVSLEQWPVIPMVMLYALSFLMVSNVRYSSFKKHSLFRRFNFHMLVACILIFVFIAAEPPAALFLISLVYVVSGPLGMFRKNKGEVLETPMEEEKLDA